MQTPDPLDKDCRKLYPAADFPSALPEPTRIPQARLTLEGPTFYFPGPGGEPVAIEEKDIDRQIAVSILEELRGLRLDLRTYHAAIYPQLVEIENAVHSQNS